MAEKEFQTFRKPSKNNPKKGRKFKERTIEEKLESRKLALVDEKYIEKALNILDDAFDKHQCRILERVVCLGLGSIVNSIKSQDQFVVLQALLSHLRARYPDKTLETSIFDPAFDEEDVDVFKRQGIHVLKEEHPLEFKQTTLLYMPHCPRSLFEALIKKNWAPENLSRLIIIGNTLSDYEDPAHTSAASSTKTPFISKSIPLWSAFVIPPDRGLALNNTSLQYVSSATLDKLSKEFWTLPGEP